MLEFLIKSLKNDLLNKIKFKFIIKCLYLLFLRNIYHLLSNEILIIGWKFLSSYFLFLNDLWIIIKIIFLLFMYHSYGIIKYFCYNLKKIEKKTSL